MKRIIRNNCRWLLVLLFGLAIPVFEMTTHSRPGSANVPDDAPASPSQTFTVTSTSDGTGAGTFRTAITNANANPGLDTIAFNLPGGGAQNIFVTSPLPAITDPVIIDGSTEPGYAGDPVISLLAPGGTFTSVINITGGGSTVRALKFFFFNGVTGGNGLIRLASNNNVVAGCVTGASGNTQVLIDGGANNRIGGSTAADRNIWFGNTGQVDNVIIKGATATGNRIVGNWFGTTPAGAISANSGNNIVIDNAPNNFVGGSTGTTPGGACTGECNLISGSSSGDGLRISGAAATGNTVIGNYFGTNAAGTTANRNGTSIHLINAPNNRIGGSTPAERNVMGAAFSFHVFAEGSANGNVVTGNYIGVRPDGASAFTGTFIAAQEGVRLFSNNNRVGGVTAGERNIISGSDYNIHIVGGFNQIYGNYIGTNAAGTAGLTTTRDGVLIEGPDNTIGTAQGTSPLVCTGGCNLISGNGLTGANNGIWILGPTATRNVIAYNYIGLNATGTAAIHNGLAPTGHSILVIGASGNTIGGPLPATSIPTPNLLAPEATVCIMADEEDAFIRFDDPSGDYLAKDCISGRTYQSPPPGTFSAFPGGRRFSAPFVSALINDTNETYFLLGDAGQLPFRRFKDSNFVHTNPCECPPNGRQFIVDYMDFGGNPGSYRNLILNNFKGVSSDQTTILAVPDERGMVVTNGTGNLFTNNFVVTLNKPAYDFAFPNIIDGGILINDSSLPPITSPQTTAPVLTAVSTQDSVTLTGTFSGNPNTDYEISIFTLGQIPAALLIENAYRETHIKFNARTGADGMGLITRGFNGAEAQVLMAPPFLAVTAIEEGEVMRPGEADSPVTIGPVSTSVMSLPIRVHGFTVSGRITTPSGAGLRNATVNLTDALTGVRRSTTTSSFGFYSFDDVTAFRSYNITVTSRLYRFAPLNRFVSDDLTNLDLLGLE